MKDVVTAQRIREIRSKYGLSQKAFAQVLGIGTATMARYEAGDPPTKAMANLIRAAENPQFMRDCLERDGSELPPRQKEKSEQLVYALCTITKEEDEMSLDINQIYEITLRQEILNEKAAEIMADLDRLIQKANDANDRTAALILDDLATQIAIFKPTIVYEENSNHHALDRIDDKLEVIRHASRALLSKAA